MHCNSMQYGLIVLLATTFGFGQLRYDAASSPPVPTSNGSTAAPGAARSSVSVVARPVPIAPGDLLNVTVFDTPELTGQVRVGRDGQASLPLIGSVDLSGLWPEQAQKLIEKRLREGDFVKEPQVTVIVSEYASQSATVMGEVVKPGTYPLVSGNRLFDVLSMASGPTQTAGTKVTITHRDNPDQPFEFTFRGAQGQISTSNVELVPGDTVIVQRAGIVYVLGDVARPGGFIMDREHLTALEAVALAQGTTKTSALNSARLLRRTAKGVEQSPLPLKSILKAKKPDPVLQAGDIVYVPGSLPKNALQMGLQGILSSAAASSIYVASGR